LPYDDSLCEQGRNFNNKIWNAFRLVKGWEVADIEQPESARMAVKWFEAQLGKTLLEIDDLFDKYRLSEALMAVYKLFWDEFSSWYLEMAKPAYQQPIDRTTYEATLGFFDSLLKVLHPFMPFITEELWQALEDRKEGESIMVEMQPKATEVDEKIILNVEEAKEVVKRIRETYQKYDINYKKEEIALFIEADNTIKNAIVLIGKLTNTFLADLNDLNISDVNFLVNNNKYSLNLGINIGAIELERLNRELEYEIGFLAIVTKKLSNENFVANAKPEIVEAERKKKADAESKIASLKEGIEALKK